MFPRAFELTLRLGLAFAALEKWNLCKIKNTSALGKAPFTAPWRRELPRFLRARKSWPSSAGPQRPMASGAPARVSKRDIARAFGVKGEAKAELKLLIKDLQAEGAVPRGRKALTVQGRLPSLVVADIAELARDGELIAKPAEWTGDGPPPRILVRRSRGKRERGPTPGLGARVLMRVEFDADAGSKAPRLFRSSGQDPRQDEGADLCGLSRVGRRVGAGASCREARFGPRISGARRHGGRSAGRRPRRD